MSTEKMRLDSHEKKVIVGGPFTGGDEGEEKTPVGGGRGTDKGKKASTQRRRMSLH